MKYTLLICLSLALALFSCEKDDIGMDASATESSGGFATGDTGGSSNDNGAGLPGDSTLQAGQLTAGEWNDLDNWDFWKGLAANDTFFQHLAHWQFHDFHRVSLELRQTDGSPVVDAEAQLLGPNEEVLWQTRTDNAGRADFFPSLLKANTTSPARIRARYLGQSYYLDEVRFYESGVNEMAIPVNGPYSQAADVFFVFDATGSMGDELEYIKVEINNIISRIRSNNGNVDFHLGSVFYRDEGDEYITRTSNLSSNFAQVVDFINSQRADGGGDYPEAVHSALEKAITEQQWRSNARARLLFLILDAPPHYEEAVMATMYEQLQLAAEKGIKIIPVAASGIDKSTEFLLRTLAIASNSTYTFITDDSGIGNPHLTPTIGDYEVEYLNDLIVRLIGKYVE